MDDDPAVCDVLGRLLTHEGFLVRTARGVDAAFTALQTGPVDVVVLDLHLPDAGGRDRSGIDVLSFMRIHEHLSSVPVVVLTGGSLTPAEEDAIWGLHAYVLKKSEGWHTLRQYLKHLTSPR